MDEEALEKWLNENVRNEDGQDDTSEDWLMETQEDEAEKATPPEKKKSRKRKMQQV